jgi:hypothetical protein
MTGPETPRIRKGLFRTSIQPAQSLTAGPRASTGGNDRSPGRAPVSILPRSKDGPTGPDQQLIILVSKLSMQVEELTSIVSQLQEQREASVVA